MRLKADGKGCKYTWQGIANVRPKGEAIATPSTCLKSFSLNIKEDTFVAEDNSSLNSSFDKSSFLSVFSNSVLEQISRVFSSGFFWDFISQYRHNFKSHNFEKRGLFA